MAYTKTTDFASKDSLLTGDPAKVVKGSEIDAEFDNIEAAFDDLGTMAGQAASAVAVTGGTIDGTTVGGTTPAAGTFTNVKVGNGGSSYFIGIPDDSYYMRIHGSNAVNQGAGVVLFGGTHGTAPNVGRLVYGSSTAVEWNGSGNVGIGTSSPAQKLHVYGNAVDTTAQITKNGTDSILVGVDSEAYVGAGYGAIAFRTGGFTSAYDKAKLDTSGNFLVGVSSATTNGGKIETSNGITFPATQSACSNANTLDDYREATFSLTTSGGGDFSGTAPSGTVAFVKVGNLVSMVLPSLSGTSISTTFVTDVCIPTVARPSSGRNVLVRASDNGGAIAIGLASINTNGTISFYPTQAAGSWTASGAKSINTSNITYIL